MESCSQDSFSTISFLSDRGTRYHRLHNAAVAVLASVWTRSDSSPLVKSALKRSREEEDLFPAEQTVFLLLSFTSYRVKMAANCQDCDCFPWKEKGARFIYLLWHNVKRIPGAHAEHIHARIGAWKMHGTYITEGGSEGLSGLGLFLFSRSSENRGISWIKPFGL